MCQSQLIPQQTSRFIDGLEILHGSYEEYLRLARYHYISPDCKPAMQIFKIRKAGKKQNSFPDPMGVILYKKPLPDLKARTYATRSYFKLPPTKSEQLKLVNEKILYAARIIIDPRFWKRGLAHWLQSETLKLQTVPIVETLTPIDFTYKLLLPDGFKRYYNPAPSYYTRFHNTLLSIGITEAEIRTPRIAHQHFMMMHEPHHSTFEKEITRFLKHFKNSPVDNFELPRTAYALSKLPYPQSYFIWFNPRVMCYDHDRADLEQKKTSTTQVRTL